MAVHLKIEETRKPGIATWKVSGVGPSEVESTRIGPCAPRDMPPAVGRPLRQDPQHTCRAASRTSAASRDSFGFDPSFKSQQPSRLHTRSSIEPKIPFDVNNGDMIYLCYPATTSLRTPAQQLIVPPVVSVVVQLPVLRLHRNSSRLLWRIAIPPGGK